MFHFRSLILKKSNLVRRSCEILGHFWKIVTLYICHFDLYLLATVSGLLSELCTFPMSVALALCPTMFKYFQLQTKVDRRSRATTKNMAFFNIFEYWYPRRVLRIILWFTIKISLLRYQSYRFIVRVKFVLAYQQLGFTLLIQPIYTIRTTIHYGF